MGNADAFDQGCNRHPYHGGVEAPEDDDAHPYYCLEGPAEKAKHAEIEEKNGQFREKNGEWIRDAVG